MTTTPDQIITELLKALPSPCECNDFNHFKKDFHGYDEPCPPLERFRLAKLNAETYIKSRKG